MNIDEQLELERKGLVAVLQHVMHRYNEFVDEIPVTRFKGEAAVFQIATEFARWLSKKDAAI